MVKGERKTLKKVECAGNAADWMQTHAAAAKRFLPLFLSFARGWRTISSFPHGDNLVIFFLHPSCCCVRLRQLTLKIALSLSMRPIYISVQRRHWPAAKAILLPSEKGKLFTKKTLFLSVLRIVASGLTASYVFIPAKRREEMGVSLNYFVTGHTI